MQKNTQAAKEAHTELRNCKQEIKDIKKFNDFRSMMNKMSNKSGEKYTCPNYYTTVVVRTTTRYFKFALNYKFYFPFAV